MAFLPLMFANVLIIIIVIAIFLAVALFISGLIVSIVFAAGKKKREAQGKKLGGKIAIPIILFVLCALIVIPLGIGGAILAIQSGEREAQTAVDNSAFSAASANELADVLDENPQIDVDEYINHAGDGYGESLLQNAVRLNDADKVEVLLSRGADPNMGAAPPLECALKADADTPGADSFFGEDDLTAGRDAYNPDIVLALLDAGADPNYGPGSSQYLTWLIKDMFGNGIDETDVEVVGSMISHGAKTTYKDNNEKYPFEVFLENAELNPAKDSSQEALYDDILVLLQ